MMEAESEGHAEAGCRGLEGGHSEVATQRLAEVLAVNSAQVATGVVAVAAAARMAADDASHSAESPAT